MDWIIYKDQRFMELLALEDQKSEMLVSVWCLVRALLLHRNMAEGITQ
jgi:hypothetical protein